MLQRCLADFIYKGYCWKKTQIPQTLGLRNLCLVEEINVERTEQLSNFYTEGLRKLDQLHQSLTEQDKHIKINKL